MDTTKKPVRGSTPQPDHILLTINGDARTTMTVTWRTCTDVEEGYVLYRRADGGDWLRADAPHHVFESDIDVSHIFSCRLPCLTPGTKYTYTCGSDTNRSEAFTFETEPENLTKFSFVCVSDQQRGEPFSKPDYSGFQRFMKTVLADHPEIRFILTGGDNTDCGQHEVQWNGMFSGCTGFIESIPYMMTLGNHDNRGFCIYEEGNCQGRFYAEPAQFFNTQFQGAYNNDGPGEWKTENYTFDYGNVHFTVYGINAPEEVNEWSAADLRRCDKTWKLASYHFPIYYSIPEGANDDAYPMMRACMEMNDLIFSGHEHNFSRSFPIRNEELFDRPSQGTVHYMLGNANSNPPGSRSTQKVWHSAFYPQSEFNSMYCLVEVDGDRLTLTSALDDGRIVDKCVIDKGRDEILPHALAPVYRHTRMFYKGMDPGLAACTTPPVERDGIWYIPAAILSRFIGADVAIDADSVTISMYRRTATFTENRDVADTAKGPLLLEAPVFRGLREQLYVPLDGFTKAFAMKWAYAKRNNFISIEKNSEDKPVPSSGFARESAKRHSE